MNNKMECESNVLAASAGQGLVVLSPVVLLS